MITGNLFAEAPRGRSWRAALATAKVPSDHVDLLEATFDDTPNERPAHGKRLAELIGQLSGQTGEQQARQEVFVCSHCNTKLRGNSNLVGEWCLDEHGTYPANEVTDPLGDHSTKVRVLRGGSWADAPEHCRAATRGYDPEVSPDIYFGLRLVLCREER